MNRKEPAEVRDLIEKESPKNIVVSFLLAMLFGVAAGLAAIAYGEVLLSLCIKVIYTLDVANTSQYTGFRRVSQITSLTTMLMGWVVAFMIVWHQIEKKPRMEQRIKFGVAAIVIALALFGIFELISYFAIGSWLSLNGGIMIS